MSEELEIPQVLDRLKEYSNLAPIERVLAAHTGTVQLLLSLWWNEPVEIIVESQTEEYGKIHRRVALICHNSGLVAAHAESIITIALNDREVIADVRAQELGLGQIVVKHEIQTVRTLHEVQVAPHELSRFYSIITTGPALARPLGVHFEIRESFPRVHYR